MHAAKGRIGDIECLRGIAVIMVIFYHAHLALFTWPMPQLDHIEANYLQTWPGVDLFFAISGFVIARTLLPSLAASESKLRTIGAFWVRRFWRLVPSAWAWLGIILIACVVFNRAGGFDTFHTNFESALAAMLSVANFRQAAAFQKFSYGPSSPYWSLSLEEQFYAVLPVIAYLSGRRLLPVLLVITAIVFTLPYEPWVMMIRVHAVLLGVLLAMASDSPVYAAFSPTFLRGRKWAGLLVLLFLLVMISALAPYGQRITGYPLDLIAVLSALLVFIASHDEDFLVGHRPIRAVLTWVGTRSYALYLVHVPAFYAARELWFRILPAGTVFGPHDLWRLSATALGLLVLGAEVNYRLLELPLRRRGAAIAARIATVDRHDDAQSAAFERSGDPFRADTGSGAATEILASGG
jgi:peptidoglycan/LPS O-acetylase OafA/YrhL